MADSGRSRPTERRTSASSRTRAPRRTAPRKRTGGSGGPAAGDVADYLAGYLRNTPARGNTTDAVTDALREAILDGALAPATWLREDEIAGILRVSRTPVREAIRRLADEGLVTKTTHQGSVVAGLSLEDILALYVVRENLEGLAGRLAAARCTPQLLADLEAAQRQMRQAARRGDPAEMSRENLEFHRLLRSAAGNPYLERYLTQVEHAVRRLRVSTFAASGRPTAVLAEHQEIIDAIRDHDGDAAERAAKQHMHEARNVRLSMVLGT